MKGLKGVLTRTKSASKSNRSEGDSSSNNLTINTIPTPVNNNTSTTSAGSSNRPLSNNGNNNNNNNTSNSISYNGSVPPLGGQSTPSDLSNVPPITTNISPLSL